MALSSFVNFGIYGSSLVLATWVASVAFRHFRLRRFLDVAPGRWTMFISPGTPISIALPIFKNTPRDDHCGWQLYEDAGSNAVSLVSLLGDHQTTACFSGAEALKAILADRFTFHKNLAHYQVIAFYGPNVVSTEFEDWRRHRNITKSAFGESNLALVWSETSRITREWFEHLDKSADGIEIIDVVDHMTRVTLMIIASAGFGHKISWAEDSVNEPPTGYKLTFRAALTEAIRLMFVRVLAPTWAYYLPIPKLHSALSLTTLAYEELGRYLKDMIKEAREAGVGEKVDADDESAGGSKKADLFRRLIAANEAEVGKLSEDELTSNVYTFLLAGHETTAHTLSFAIGLLATHPDAQQKVYEEALALWPENDWPLDDLESYKKDFPKLEYTLATFRETLRLYPAEPRLGKLVASDQVVPALKRAPDGTWTEKFGVPLEKGNAVLIDILGLQTCPLYWGDDAWEFKPERFIDTDSYKWPRDAFIPFASGPRACLGQRFSTVESMALLSHIVRRYEILLPPNLEGKSLKEQERVLLKWTAGVTATPVDMKVRLRRRY